MPTKQSEIPCLTEHYSKYSFWKTLLLTNFYLTTHTLNIYLYLYLSEHNSNIGRQRITFYMFAANKKGLWTASSYVIDLWQKRPVFGCVWTGGLTQSNNLVKISFEDIQLREYIGLDYFKKGAIEMNSKVSVIGIGLSS